MEYIVEELVGIEQTSVSVDGMEPMKILKRIPLRRN